jgi:hypothetical protein
MATAGDDRSVARTAAERSPVRNLRLDDRQANFLLYKLLDDYFMKEVHLIFTVRQEFL